MRSRGQLVTFLVFVACSEPPAPDRPDTVALVPICVPGTATDLKFSLRRSIAWQDSIHLAVIDADQVQLVILGLDGSERRVGRKGDGPGEFRSPLSLTRLEDGGLVVISIPAMITRFDAAMHPGPRYLAGSWPNTVLGGHGDTLYLLSQVFNPPLGRAIDRITGVSGVRTTIARFDTLDPSFSIDPEGGPPPGAAAAGRPDGGFVVAQEGSYLMLWLSSTGTVERRGGRTGLVAPLPSAEEVARREAGIEVIEKQLGDPRMVADLRAQLARDKVRPQEHLTKVAVDERGWTWVLTTRGLPGATWFDLFAPEGRYRAVATVPGETWAFALLGGKIAVLQAAAEADPEVDARVRVFRVGSTASIH